MDDNVIEFKLHMCEGEVKINFNNVKKIIINRCENLRMICPNCDSQLPTFKSKNKNSTRRNYWKEHIIKSFSELNNQPEEEL